jgi:hypothetical protein
MCPPSHAGIITLEFFSRLLVTAVDLSMLWLVNIDYRDPFNTCVVIPSVYTPLLSKKPWVVDFESKPFDVPCPADLHSYHKSFTCTQSTKYTASIHMGDQKLRRQATRQHPRPQVLQASTSHRSFRTTSNYCLL